MSGRRPHILVLGNEKGGSGKSTTAMHIIVSLLKEGRTVGSLDLDARQGTLTRYVENRRRFIERGGLSLPMPEHRPVPRGAAASVAEVEADEQARFEAALADVARTCEVVVVDCPGNDSFLARLAHVYADTLLTPINDSFLDLDVLATVEPDSMRIERPSVYAEMVWEQRKRRAMHGGRPIDWVVMRNRLSSLDARNKRQIGRLVDELARRVGFRSAPGLTERVIFRELFLKGLTLLDLRESGAGVAMSMSHVAARQEVRALMAALALPQPATPETV